MTRPAMKILKWWCTYYSILMLNTAAAQSIHAPLRAGDQAYDKEQYKTAEKNYRIAADRDMGNPQAVFNLGNALFQQGNFEDAGKRFLQASEKAQKPELQADALHNLGDANLKQRKYKEAANAYEQSLRIRPADPTTKQNLQMAKKKLREEEQQKQQQQPSQQPDSNQDSNQPEPENPEKPSDKPQEQPNQPPPPNHPGQEPPKQQKNQEEQQLKKEEAKRLLETAVGSDDRKNARKYRAAQQQAKPKGSKKDW